MRGRKWEIWVIKWNNIKSHSDKLTFDHLRMHNASCKSIIQRGIAKKPRDKQWKAVNNIQERIKRRIKSRKIKWKKRQYDRLTPNQSIITLNVNRLNTRTIRYRLSDLKKVRPNYMQSTRDILYVKTQIVWK